MIQQKNQKRHVIYTLVEIRKEIDRLLADLCDPCPECCPPRFPCEPGEVANHGTGDIHMCEHCWGRGYLVPDEDNNDDS